MRPWVRDAVRRTDDFGLLLVLLLTALVLTGIDGRLPRTLVAVVNSAVLLVTFRGSALGRTRVGTVALVALAVLGWASASAFDPDEAVGASAWLIQAAILTMVTFTVARRILSHQRVTLQTIAGALSMYVLIGLVFGMVFGAVEAMTEAVMLRADSGVREDPIYYSFVTLTTVGFGDVTSPSDLVRRITIVEAIVGQIFLATMVARLVSVYGSERIRHRPGE